MQNFESHWKNHPNPEVDLCVMSIMPLINYAHTSGNELFFIPLDKSLIPTNSQLKDLKALEDVIMMGYPNGIWDRVNNKPIFRKGITATHPYNNYDGKEEFMIDAACFPGSSGSPVFLLNEGSYQDRQGNTYMGQTRIFLLVILYAGPQHTITGEIEIIDIPTSDTAVPISRIPNNLGLIIKSSRINELEGLF
ncbi:S1 family peptidase [Lacicoccus alkaliphilus]|uniref:S1 family peptidase n=1 Tax=Lacicoccus alkaliphilus TaxID=148453 RepID=UPI002481BC62|nr:serine protease [Salinicoccus alkaliphilus]